VFCFISGDEMMQRIRVLNSSVTVLQIRRKAVSWIEDLGAVRSLFTENT
jgi:hypothetical protein